LEVIRDVRLTYLQPSRMFSVETLYKLISSCNERISSVKERIEPYRIYKKITNILNLYDGNSSKKLEFDSDVILLEIVKIEKEIYSTLLEEQVEKEIFKKMSKKYVNAMELYVDNAKEQNDNKMITDDEFEKIFKKMIDEMNYMEMVVDFGENKFKFYCPYCDKCYNGDYCRGNDRDKNAFDKQVDESIAESEARNKKANKYKNRGKTIYINVDEKTRLKLEEELLIANFQEETKTKTKSKKEIEAEQTKQANKERDRAKKEREEFYKKAGMVYRR